MSFDRYQLARCLIALNMLDLICTVLWLDANMATEANTLMLSCLYYSPWLFFLVKLLVPTAGMIFLATYNRKKALLSLMGVYGLIMVSHITVFTLHKDSLDNLQLFI